VIEDAAHGLGAKYKGKYLGTIGHFGGYSLHEVKTINSFGEGGLLVTNLASGAQFSRARFLGLNFSRTIKNWLYDITALEDRFGRPQIPGNHSAMELQALGFNLQIERLPQIIARRRANAEYLRAAFAKEESIILDPVDTARTFGSHHLFLLRIDTGKLNADIQTLKLKFKEKGLTEIAHFGPLYKFDIFRRKGYSEKAVAATCPRTEDMFNHAFTHLPLYPLSREQLAYMAKAVLQSIQELKR
jgi:dTDP-4-amino-4,6-dideoxygalactose transaminase